MSEKKRLRSLVMAASLLFALCLGRGSAQNDYPPPQSVIPQLAGQPPGNQALILGGRTDALDQHLYATDGRQQKQFARLNVLEQAQDKKDTQQWSQVFWNLANSAADGGLVLYHVNQTKKRRRRKSDENQDDNDG